MITEITRQAIISRIQEYWHGSLDPIDFLERIYPLDELPSEDLRFNTFRKDIIQHTINNNDWEYDWIFRDNRLALNDSDKFLRFLAEVFHPLVSRDADVTVERINEINQLLLVDGYELFEYDHQSGYPVYSYRKIQPQIRPIGPIPDSIIATISIIISQRYSHSDIDTLFELYDFPRPTSVGSNKQTRAKAWLTEINKIKTFDRWKALGQIVKEITEEDLNEKLSTEQMSSDNALIFSKLKEKNLSYQGNGLITKEYTSTDMQTIERIDLIPWLIESNKLGEGGFGKVYRYDDNRLQIPFAIKVYDPSPFQDSPEKGKKRFFREASILFKLRNKHIVQVYDAGELPDGRPYIKMEYFPGLSLQQHLSDYGMPSTLNRLTIIGRVTAALAHAHEQKIIHRDLKPTNILIDASNYEIRLIDFGLGILIEDIIGKTRLTQTKEGLSNSSYLAPELLDNAKLLNSKSDIYSLGAIWFKLLTGLAPRGTGIDEVLYKSSAPKAELELLQKCLRLDAESRPDSSSLIEQLRDLVRASKKET